MRNSRIAGSILPEALAGLGGVSLGALATAAVQTAIGPDSVITLSTVGGICGGIIWLNVTLSKIKSDLAGLKSASRETWTWNQMRAWTADLREANPEMTVPRPERPLWASEASKE